MGEDVTAALGRIEGLAEKATRGAWGNDADFALIAAAHTDLPRLAAVVRAVLGVHEMVPGWDVPKCGLDSEVWPCRTVRAATKAWEADR